VNPVRQTAEGSRRLRFDAGPVTLTGERWEAGEPTVILLHGTGQTRHSWRRTGARLQASGRTAIALDLRGHGDSDWDPTGDYSIDAFLADLTGFLSSLDRPAVLVGASLGGVASLLIAGERPDLVAGLVLVDIAIRVNPDGVARIHSFMAGNPDGFESLEEAAAAIAAYNPQRPRRGRPEGLRKNLRRGEDGRWRWHWDPEVMSLTGSGGRLDPPRLEAAAARVEVPTLLVHGAASELVGSEAVEDLRRRIPRAEAVDVARAGHMVAGDDNDLFAASLEGYLDRLPGAAA
jgi:pimeloyl-ACP methyl ester carboxylesterase